MKYSCSKSHVNKLCEREFSVQVHLDMAAEKRSELLPEFCQIKVMITQSFTMHCGFAYILNVKSLTMPNDLQLPWIGYVVHFSHSPLLNTRQARNHS